MILAVLTGFPDFDSYPQHSDQITPQVTDFTKHDFSLRQKYVVATGVI